MKKLFLALALLVLASPAYAQCGAGQPPAGTVCAAPAGSAGVATYRLLGNGHIPSGIDAAKVGGGSVSTTEYDRLNGITAFGQSIIDDADAAAVRTTIGTAIGTNVQAFDADLTTWAGISPSADMQSLAAAANYAAMRALLDLEAGTDFYSIAGADAAFQPLDADLTALSAAAFSRATASTASWLRLFEDTDNGTNYIEFIAPASIGTNRQCQLVDGGAPIPDSCVGDGVDDGAGGGISDIVQDLTPQLGGALDTNGFAIELGSGNTDTSLTRSAAGQISVEGVVIPTVSSTNTLSNKSIDGGSNTITGIGSTAITDGAVANADLANMAQATVKGRAAGAGTGAPVDLSQTQLTAIVNTFTTSLSGAAPASGGGTTNFLRADGTWAAPGGGASADVQTFNSSGTWTKPSGNLTMLECWGGGGSGARRNTTGQATGGGGGSYTKRIIATSSLGATETVTIGTGGASVTTSDADGNTGGTTTFGSWLSAYGGGGGANLAASTGGPGGAGAGILGSASNVTAGAGGGTAGTGTAVAHAGNEGSGAPGGGASSGNVAQLGGNGFGGGGGGGAASSGNNSAGGSSVLGGGGGAGNSGSNATAGSQPGGGGGGARSGGSSGAGGAGRCVATTW